MRNLEFQTKKEVRSETNPKTFILKEYYNFVDVFSKKDLDTLFSYQKYDHKIILEDKHKYNHAFLYKILL